MQLTMSYVYIVVGNWTLKLHPQQCHPPRGQHLAYNTSAHNKQCVDADLLMAATPTTTIVREAASKGLNVAVPSASVSRSSSFLEPYEQTERKTQNFKSPKR
jgi:hypothetical protein